MNEQIDEVRMSKRIVIYKHMLSCLGDQEFKYEIDTQIRTVIVRLREFDSSLFTRFIQNLDSEGIRTFADDNEGWTPTPPAWAIHVLLGDHKYLAVVARLMETGGRHEFGIVLKPWNT